MSSAEARRPEGVAHRDDLAVALGEYRELWRPRGPADAEHGARTHLVSRFYDFVTRFYEYGWGTSFHFSPRRPGERLAEAQRRHEEDIGRLLGLRSGMRVADFGCGIGGPLTAMARATGASIVGINNNAYQIARGERMVGKAGLDDSCGFLLTDFMSVPLPDDHFDAAYTFESICHAPDPGGLFREIFRVLRPGGVLAAVDWTLTDRFDASDRRHRDVIARVELGNACPGLLTPREQVDAVAGAGFEVLDCIDQAAAGDPRTPWYMSLQARDFSLSSLARIPAGRAFTAMATRLLERLRILPSGTHEAAVFLNGAADALVESGELGIFTPNLLVHARKPSHLS